MKALIADKLEPEAIDALRGLCDEVTLDPTLGGAALAEACEDADILVVRSTKVEREVFERARRLALVIRAGAGVNTIDVPEAARRGVFVANCPGKNAAAVAELALGLMLALDRQIADNVAELRAGRWDKARFGQARGLAGRRVGVVGSGRIGARFLAACRALGMEAVVYDPFLTDDEVDELGAERADTLEELVEACDVVSIHVPMSATTKGMFSRELLGRMKDGAILLNTSRAGVVDEAALIEAVRERGLRAGLDVMEGEPAAKACDFATPLAGLPGVYVTHHIGASTEQAQTAVADEVVRIVRAFLEVGRVPNCVNLCPRSPATHQIAVRHEDKVGVLAAVLGCVSRHGLNVEELENIIYDGAQAACCFIRLDGEPGADLLAALDALPSIIGVTAQQLP